MPRSVAIILFGGVEELDFVGPKEVFGYLAHLKPDVCRVQHGIQSFPEPSYRDVPPRP